MVTGFEKYLDEFETCRQNLLGQSSVTNQIVDLIFDSLISSEDSVFHVFGSGHSHILSYELFHRAGGLVPVNPIFAESTMPHKGPSVVRESERKPGFAREVFESADIRKGEVVFIVSNSGINAYPVEFAEACKKAGAVPVAITSLPHSKKAEARSNKKLFEVCEYVLDTGVPYGDAVVPLRTSEVNVGPLSTLITVLIGEMIVIKLAEKYESQGLTPPVLKSANSKGGDAFNRSLEERYAKRIPLLQMAD